MDPSSATATLMELVRSYSILLHQGWRPRRSIVSKRLLTTVMISFIASRTHHGDPIALQLTCLNLEIQSKLRERENILKE